MAETLGERALRWCLVEAYRWADLLVPLDRTSEYLSGCVRTKSPGLGAWLVKTNPTRLHSFCAAAQGFAEHQVELDPRVPWRAGALELEADARAGARVGERWAPASEFLRGGLFLKAAPPGSLVVYGNTRVAGKGHVERLIEMSGAGLRSVGANENRRRWVVDAEPIPWDKLQRADASQRLELRGFIVPA